MNMLLAGLVAAVIGAAPVEQVYEEHVHEIAAGELKGQSVKYRLMKPAKVERGKTYPLVVFLHGAGERGEENRRQLKFLPTWMADEPYRSKYPCYLVAPQCRGGMRWVEVDWGAKKSTPMAKKPGAMMRSAIEIVDGVIDKYPIDKRRIYLTGLSMGGYGSWELAMRRAELFAAVAPICGGGDERQAARLKDVPLFAYHGGADRVVPTERTRQMIAAIRAAGGQPRYKELPGVGHASWPAAYRDADGVVPWMFSQARPEKPHK